MLTEHAVGIGEPERFVGSSMYFGDSHVGDLVSVRTHISCSKNNLWSSWRRFIHLKLRSPGADGVP